MPTEWKPLLDGLVGLLERLRSAEERDRQQRNLALVAVLTAANQTRGYIRATQDGAPRDIEHEHALSNLWDTCSIALEQFDADIARRCQLKGQYWRDPEQWSVTDINETRLGLDRVRKEAEYLLRLRIRPHREGPVTGIQRHFDDD
jgi:hypothetical protein